MQRNIKSLIGYSIGATDGEIGKVEEFYFDDKSWVIRYLVVKTGSWLLGRKVLISPQAVQKIDWNKKDLPVNLTREKVQNSPDIDSDKPVCRQQEIELYGHYAWQRYGGSGFFAGGSTPFLNSPIIVDEKVVRESDSNDDRKDDDIHLRSNNTVISYHLHATDGEIGHVNDFIIDAETWQIVSVVIDTHNFIGGEKVLIPVEKIKELLWLESKVIVDMDIVSIKNSAPVHEAAYNNSASANLASEKS